MVFIFVFTETKKTLSNLLVMYAVKLISWWVMKLFSQYMQENSNQSGVDLVKFPAEIQDKIIDKSMSIFEHMMRKYPSDCIDFISKFTEKDEFIKSEMDSMKSLENAFSGNPKEYGLGYIKGNYPKTGLNN